MKGQQLRRLAAQWQGARRIKRIHNHSRADTAAATRSQAARAHRNRPTAGTNGKPRVNKAHARKLRRAREQGTKACKAHALRVKERPVFHPWRPSFARNPAPAGLIRSIRRVQEHVGPTEAGLRAKTGSIRAKDGSTIDRRTAEVPKCLSAEVPKPKRAARAW